MVFEWLPVLLVLSYFAVWSLSGYQYFSFVFSVVFCSVVFCVVFEWVLIVLLYFAVWSLSVTSTYRSVVFCCVVFEWLPVLLVLSYFAVWSLSGYQYFSFCLILLCGL